MIVRRRSLALALASVCTPPAPAPRAFPLPAAAVDAWACASPGCGASSDKCDLAPIVRLPRPPSANFDPECICAGGGRSVSEPERDDAQGDLADELALNGVTADNGVCGGGPSLVDGRCRCRCKPLSALTLTVNGRLNDTVFCLLDEAALDDDADADVADVADDWPESVRVTGSVVMAVVGAALGVVMFIPGLARMVVVTVETAPKVFLRVSLSVCVCCCACCSDGRVGSGGGMASWGSLLRTLLSSSDWRGRGAGVGEGS